MLERKAKKVEARADEQKQRADAAEAVAHRFVHGPPFSIKLSARLMDLHAIGARLLDGRSGADEPAVQRLVKNYRVHRLTG